MKRRHSFIQYWKNTITGSHHGDFETSQHFTTLPKRHHRISSWCQKDITVDNMDETTSQVLIMMAKRNHGILFVFLAKRHHRIASWWRKCHKISSHWRNDVTRYHQSQWRNDVTRSHHSGEMTSKDLFKVAKWRRRILSHWRNYLTGSLHGGETWCHQWKLMSVCSPSLP